jgi:hypothetical protein
MRARWSLLLLAAACTEPPGGQDDDANDGLGGKDDGTGAGGFSEVDPAHSNKTFRKYIEAAIVALERDPSDIARLTAKSIRDRRVKIDELVDLTCWDFERARKDLPDAGFVPDDYHHLQDRGSPIAATLTNELDGYMWSNRIYVSRGQTVKRLASTLVHEVNHVINRSEVGYYDDLPTSGFQHEYRAFHAESIFDPDEWAGIDLVDHVIENYELDRSKIPDAILREPLTPRLLPDAAAWRDRKVSADARDIDAECPSNL